MEDSQIIELYWKKNTDAISKTADKYGAYCYAIAENILHNHEDSEECVNDTWLHAWNAMPPQKPNVLRLFLAKITRNLSLDRFNVRNAEKRGGGEITLVLVGNIQRRHNPQFFFCRQNQKSIILPQQQFYCCRNCFRTIFMIRSISSFVFLMSLGRHKPLAKISSPTLPDSLCGKKSQSANTLNSRGRCGDPCCGR